MPASDFPEAPVLVTAMTDADIERWRAGLPGFHIGTIDGQAAATEAALFDQMATAFAAPEHFGGNWDAVFDVLADLSWLDADGYVVLVADAEALLGDENEDRFDVFLAVMVALAEEWERGGGAGEHRRLVFRTVLRADDADGCRRLEERVGDAADVARFNA